MSYEKLSNDDYLELALEDIEKDAGSFYNWALKDDGDNLRQAMLNDLLPHLLSMMIGEDKIDCTTDLIEEFEPYLISYAINSNYIREKWEDEQSYGSEDDV